MPQPGSGPNVFAALASLVIPGLGQLLQGRGYPALVFFVLALVGWAVGIGWVFHLGGALEAGAFRGEDY